jgi:hypothetical protein
MSNAIDTLKTSAQFYLDITDDNTPSNQARIALHQASRAWKDVLSQLQGTEHPGPELQQLARERHALYESAKVKYGAALCALADQMNANLTPDKGPTS